MHLPTRLLLYTAIAGAVLLAVGIAPVLSAPDEKEEQPAKRPLDLDEEAIKRGKQQYDAYCKPCHSIDGSIKIGMPLNEKWGTTVSLKEEDDATYDEDFFRESLTAPDAKITKGYMNQMPRSNLDEPAAEDLIVYLKSLGDPDLVRKSEERMRAKREKMLAELKPNVVKMPRICTPCDDLKAALDFYTVVLLVPPVEYRDNAKRGWLMLNTGSTLLVFYRAGLGMPPELNWLESEPAGETGTLNLSLDIPEHRYRIAISIAGLRDAGKPLMNKPVWHTGGYWQFLLEDPMGNTVELTWTPKQQPAKGETPEWKDE